MTFIAKKNKQKKKNKKKKKSNKRRGKTKLSLNIATCCFNEIGISLSEIELCACSKARGWVYGFLHPI